MFNFLLKSIFDLNKRGLLPNVNILIFLKYRLTTFWNKNATFLIFLKKNQDELGTDNVGEVVIGLRDLLNTPDLKVHGENISFRPICGEPPKSAAKLPQISEIDAEAFPPFFWRIARRPEYIISHGPIGSDTRLLSLSLHSLHGRMQTGSRSIFDDLRFPGKLWSAAREIKRTQFRGKYGKRNAKLFVTKNIEEKNFLRSSRFLTGLFSKGKWCFRCF